MIEFRESKEVKIPPEVLKAKSFLIKELSAFINREKLQNVPIKELFEDYKNLINSEASLENFQKLKEKYNDTETNQENFNNQYREYLLKKLPKELRERHIKSNTSIKDLEKVHYFRKKNNCQMILGFHVSNVDIPEGETIWKSYSESQIGDIVLPAGQYVQYSTNPQYLWSCPGSSRYLYLVEGSTANKIIDKQGWRASAVYDKKGLEILAKIELTHELEKALGLQFRET